MTADTSRQKRLLTGCGIAALSSVGLMLFALAYRVLALRTAVLFPALVLLVLLTGVGATIAVFNLRRP
jgi:hypothetical protein